MLAQTGCLSVTLGVLLMLLLWWIRRISLNPTDAVHQQAPLDDKKVRDDYWRVGGGLWKSWTNSFHLSYHCGSQRVDLNQAFQGWCKKIWVKEVPKEDVQGLTDKFQSNKSPNLDCIFLRVLKEHITNSSNLPLRIPFAPKDWKLDPF